MSDIPPFSLDGVAEPSEDTQAKLLHNALKKFCDKIIADTSTTDAEKNVVTREVTWQLNHYFFRAKLITFDNQVSLGQYEYSEDAAGGEWQRLVTPRALAEKLTEAKELAQH